MINHNSNIIEAYGICGGGGGAGSGSLFLEDAIVYLKDTDYPGSGSWLNRVGTDITISGSLSNSGSAGWAFNGSNSRLNLGDSVPAVSFAAADGITFVLQAQLGTYPLVDGGLPVLLFNSLNGQIFSPQNGYNGASYEYVQTGSFMAMKNGANQDVQELPDFVSSSVNLFAITKRNTSGDAFLYFNNDSTTIIQPTPGSTLGFGDNPVNSVVFGNFPDQVITVPSIFYTFWQRYKGTVKTMLIYNRALTDGQLRRVFNNIRAGAV